MTDLTIRQAIALLDPETGHRTTVNPDGSINVVPSGGLSAANRANRAHAQINITDNSVHSLLPAQVGEYADLLMILFANTSSTGTEVDLSDGTNTKPIFCPANFTFGFICPFEMDEATKDSAWTLQCTSGVNTLKVSAVFQLNTA